MITSAALPISACVFSIVVNTATEMVIIFVWYYVATTTVCFFCLRNTERIVKSVPLKKIKAVK